MTTAGPRTWTLAPASAGQGIGGDTRLYHRHFHVVALIFLRQNRARRDMPVATSPRLHSGAGDQTDR